MRLVEAGLVESCCGGACSPVTDLFDIAASDVRAVCCVSTGPVQEPPGVPSDGGPAATARHPLHASADQRFKPAPTAHNPLVAPGDLRPDQSPSSTSPRAVCLSILSYLAVSLMSFSAVGTF